MILNGIGNNDGEYALSSQDYVILSRNRLEFAEHTIGTALNEIRKQREVEVELRKVLSITLNSLVEGNIFFELSAGERENLARTLDKETNVYKIEGSLIEMLKMIEVEKKLRKVLRGSFIEARGIIEQKTKTRNRLLALLAFLSLYLAAEAGRNFLDSTPADTHPSAVTKPEETSKHHPPSQPEESDHSERTTSNH